PMHLSFLFSKEGNPNKRNVNNETCLHVLCQGPQILLLPEGALSPRLARPQRDEQRRADCLQVETRGGTRSARQRQQLCRDLFVEDEDKLTPCDHAERHHHTELALSLESQMVFSSCDSEILWKYFPSSKVTPYEGLKLQDLRRLKDMLIVETADMLQAPLFTAEALLRAHGTCVFPAAVELNKSQYAKSMPGVIELLS
uniref:Uncharacterized protein n=1 Tax=Nothobranchius furzeri TaxID=105023 RepID=A0A8C6W177_NOTFU